MKKSNALIEQAEISGEKYQTRAAVRHVKLKMIYRVGILDGT
jgi:hypothetical protein